MMEVTGPWWRPLGQGGGHWTMGEATGPWGRLLVTFVSSQGGWNEDMGRASW